MSVADEPAIAEGADAIADFTMREGAFLMSVGAAQFRHLLSKSGVKFRSNQEAYANMEGLSYDQIFKIGCFYKIGTHLSSSRRQIFMSNLRFPVMRSFVDCGGGIYADVMPIEKEMRLRHRELKRTKDLIQATDNSPQNAYILKRSGYSVYKVYINYLKDNSLSAMKLRFPNICADDVLIAKNWSFIEPPKGRRNILV